MNEDSGICRSMCKEYRVRKPRDGTSRYLSGQVRCQKCGVFITRHGCHDGKANPVTDETINVYCKCCNCVVRSKPRNKPKLKHFKKTIKDEYEELKKKSQ